MKVQARAKINLALDVVERMDNGYHSLDMIMAPISIFDEIEIEKSACDEVMCEGMKLPENGFKNGSSFKRDLFLEFQL